MAFSWYMYFPTMVSLIAKRKKNKLYYYVVLAFSQ